MAGLTSLIEDVLGRELTNAGLWPVPPASVHKADELRWPSIERRANIGVTPMFTGHPIPLGGDL